MTLRVDLKHAFDGFTLDATFDAPVGLTALFGPSGSGKTTVINAIAGLLCPTQGRIAVGDKTLFDRDARINVPVAKRDVGYVFQDARLFPHMSVARNLAYGGQHNADHVVQMLGLEGLLDRRPDRLSGGERQRVALGRALMRNPRLLLLDEPLSALDAPRKDEIMPYLERLRDSTDLPILYVSHDVSEVARLANHIVLMDHGKVRLSGPIDDVLSSPVAVPYLGASDAGAVISGRVMGYDAGDQLTTVTISKGQLLLPGDLGPVGTLVRVRVPAQEVILSLHRPTGMSALNVIEAQITGMSQGQGPGVAVGLQSGNDRLLSRVTRRSAAAMNLADGMTVFALIKATGVPARDVAAAGTGRDRMMRR